MSKLFLTVVHVVMHNGGNNGDIYRSLKNYIQNFKMVKFNFCRSMHDDCNCCSPENQRFFALKLVLICPTINVLKQLVTSDN